MAIHHKGKNNPVYIIDGLRTPIGRHFGGLKDCSLPEMTAVVISALLSRNKINRRNVSELILGNAVSGGTGQNFARQAVFLAGLPISVPAYVIRNVCGSGLQAIILGMQSIMLEEAEVVMAGAAESASGCPELILKSTKTSSQDRTPIDSLIYDGLWCLLAGKLMGQICEDIAMEYHISRGEQDQYAFQSHKKASQAQAEGMFSKQIISVKGPKGRVFERDECIRKNISLTKLKSLPTVFSVTGAITAGNSSAPGDGACVLALASQKTLKNLKLTPRAQILSYASIATPPDKVFAYGMEAIQKCLQRAGLSFHDIDLFEISEAFAAQAILTKRQVKIPDEKMNVWGGDIALGHPLGAAGTRSLVTLIHALKSRKKKKGVVCVAMGGGGVIAMAIEAVS